MSGPEQRPIDLDTAIANHLRFLRERDGIPREIVALKARHWGLDWSAGTLSLIEDGRRRLSIGEFLLLPKILSDVGLKPEFGSGPFTLQDLLPSSKRAVQIDVTPHLHANFGGLGQLLDNKGVMNPQIQELFDSPRGRELSFYDEVTARMAKALKVPIPRLAATTQQLWGRPLRDERGARFKAELERTGEAKPSPRRKQALLGHIARGMMKEIREELTQSKGEPTHRRPAGKAKTKGGRS